MTGIDLAQDLRHHAAPVVAGRPVGFVAKTVHEGRPRVGGAYAIPAWFVRRTGEAKARHRRNYHVKRQRRIGMDSARVGQGFDDAGVLEHRSWPAMTEQEGNGVWLGRADVQEVHALAVYD